MPVTKDKETGYDGCAGSRVRVCTQGPPSFPLPLFPLSPFSHPCCTSFLPFASQSAALPSYPRFSGMWGRVCVCENDRQPRFHFCLHVPTHIGRQPLGEIGRQLLWIGGRILRLLGVINPQMYCEYFISSCDSQYYSIKHKCFSTGRGVYFLSPRHAADWSLARRFAHSGRWITADTRHTACTIAIGRTQCMCIIFPILSARQGAATQDRARL